MHELRNVKNDIVVKVLRIISDHTIHEPITGEVIAQMIGATWRQVAHAVEVLRYMGFKIGSSKTKPMGYFLARTREEIEPTAIRMKKQCLVQLKQVQQMYVWNNQPTIFDGVALADVEKAVEEFENITGQRMNE